MQKLNPRKFHRDAANVEHASNRPKPSIALIALVAIVALEAVFAAMARLGDLSLHIPEFMAWRWAAASSTSSRSTRSNTRETTAPCCGSSSWARCVFRLTLFPQPPSLSTDLSPLPLGRPRPERGLESLCGSAHGPAAWPLRDPGWYVMPVPEIPTMYPPLLELVFRATWRVLPEPGWLQAAVPAGRSCRRGDARRVDPFDWGTELPGGHLRLESAGRGRIRLQRPQRRARHRRCRRYAVDYTAASGNVNAYADGRGAGESVPATLLPLALRRAGWPRKLRGWLAAAAAARRWLRLVRLALSARLARISWRCFTYYQLILRNYHSSIYPVLLWLTGSHEIAAGVGEGVVIGLALWLACARRSTDARRVSADRHGAALRAERLFVVLHLDCAAVVFLSESRRGCCSRFCNFSRTKFSSIIDRWGVWHFDPFFQWLLMRRFMRCWWWEFCCEAKAHTDIRPNANR